MRFRQLIVLSTAIAALQCGRAAPSGETLVPTEVPAAQLQDVNLDAFVGPTNNGQVIEVGLADAGSGGLASALKFSVSLADCTVHAQKAIGGHDACVDVNNLCRNLTITVDELWPTGQFAATIKGGVSNITLSGRLMRHAQKFDVIIGDWSDQSHNWTTAVTLGIIPDDGQPVVVCVLAGDKPKTLPGTGPYVYRFPLPDDPLHNFWVFCFETLRRWGLFRAQAN